MMPTKSVLLNELQKTVSIFGVENTYTEVRILNTSRGTISGYFNDVDKMYQAIRRYDGRYNIFFTLNEPISGIEARSVNHLKEFAKNTTTDNEIALRHWILIDLDPERPSGISSTDEELAKAKELSGKIRKFLSDNGFPDPVTALSGNGYHLLYPINMPNDAESAQLIKELLKVLSARFSDGAVKVDTSNYNAARITKLYGTVACKGDHTESRPYRRSGIISVPDHIIEVSMELIKAVVQDNSYKEKELSKEDTKEGSKEQNTAGQKKSDKSFSLGKWLSKHQMKVARKKNIEDGLLYVLEECPWNKEHSRDKGAYVIEYSNGNIVAGCHHDSCKEKGVNWESLWKMKEGKAALPNMKKEKSLEKSDNTKESPADILFKLLAEKKHEYFRNRKDDVFVQVPENGCFTSYPLNSEFYRKLITRIYYNATKKSIKKDMVSQALEALEAQATFEGKVYDTYKRFAFYDGKLYYSLADTSNTILCIDENGIRVCQNPPVQLIRSNYMQEQPMPIEGRELLPLLRKYYHFESEDDEILHAVILITRLVTEIEQPVVIYTGPKGSFKTTSMEMDKKILDDSNRRILMMPKNEEDFLLILNSEDVICFDNIDNISKTQADILCMVLSGATALKRKKYTDAELCEVNLKATVYLNGINLLSGRTDFLSRCIFINTKTSALKEAKKGKSEITKEFDADKPYILYGVFDIFSKAVAIYNQDVSINVDDRLVDFIQWGCAIAEVMGYGGSRFLEAYTRNRQDIDEEALADDEVANAVMLYFEEHDSFDGTSTEFSKELMKLLSDKKNNISNKIKCPPLLSRRLNELNSSFSKIGIEVETGKSKGKRYVKLCKGKETL